MKRWIQLFPHPLNHEGASSCLNEIEGLISRLDEAGSWDGSISSSIILPFEGDRSLGESMVFFARANKGFFITNTPVKEEIIDRTQNLETACGRWRF